MASTWLQIGPGRKAGERQPPEMAGRTVFALNLFVDCGFGQPTPAA
jgi:hypothetical protein